jgi:hypothetical protein
MEKRAVKILCVEDEPSLLNHYKKILGVQARTFGLELNLSMASTLKQFRELMNGNNYAIYISDGFFPRDSVGEKPEEFWRDVCDEISSREGGLDKLILISANERVVSEAREKGIRACLKGNTDYIQVMLKALRDYKNLKSN